MRLVVGITMLQLLQIKFGNIMTSIFVFYANYNTNISKMRWPHTKIYNIT